MKTVMANSLKFHIFEALIKTEKAKFQMEYFFTISGNLLFSGLESRSKCSIDRNIKIGAWEVSQSQQ